MGLPHVLKQVSQKVDFEVSSLLLVVFHQGQFVSNGTIDNAILLKERDVVLALRRGEAATSLIAEVTAATHTSQKKKAVPPPPRRVSKTATTTGEDGHDEDGFDDNDDDFAPQKKKEGPPKYKVGTKVRKKFGDHGWFDGEIVDIKEKRRSYIVKYSDGDIEEYWWDTYLIDKMVKEAKNKKRSRPSKASIESKRRRSSMKEAPGSNSSMSARLRILQQPSLTYEQRRALIGKKFDVEEFRRYLIEEEELKQADKIVRKVENFTQNGFRYKYWSMGVVFHPDPITDLDEDFSKMIVEAERHEDTHGHIQDGGLKQILQKLENFQKHCWNKDNQLQAGAAAAKPPQEMQQQQEQIVPDSILS